MKALKGNTVLAQNRLSLRPPGLSCFYKLFYFSAEHPLLAFCPSLLFHREVWLLLLPSRKTKGANLLSIFRNGPSAAPSAPGTAAPGSVVSVR